MSLERRGSQRIPSYLPVRLFSPEGQSLIETLTKDLSIGGIRCLTQKNPDNGSYEIELILAEGTEPIQAKGRIAWSRLIPQGEQFEVGITFTDISIACRERLQRYIQRLTSHMSS